MNDIERAMIDLTFHRNGECDAYCRHCEEERAAAADAEQAENAAAMVKHAGGGR